MLPAFGALEYDATGNPRCHVCGNAFVHLASHLRHHQMTAASYRLAFGLNRLQSLVGHELRARMAEAARRSGRVARLTEGKQRVGQQGGARKGSKWSAQARANHAMIVYPSQEHRRIIRSCVVCGNPVPWKRDAPRKTCSDECFRERTRQSNRETPRLLLVAR